MGCLSSKIVFFKLKSSLYLFSIEGWGHALTQRNKICKFWQKLYKSNYSNHLVLQSIFHYLHFTFSILILLNVNHSLYEDSFILNLKCLCQIFYNYCHKVQLITTLIKFLELNSKSFFKFCDSYCAKYGFNSQNSCNVKVKNNVLKDLLHHTTSQ